MQLKDIVTYIVFPFTLIIALGGAVKTWNDYDLWKPASIQYVDKKVDTSVDTVRPVVYDIQVEIAAGKLEQTEELLFRWKRVLETATADDKKLIERRIKELENTKMHLEGQINSIKQRNSNISKKSN